MPGPEWSPVIIATGPLTSDALSQSIQQMVGEEHLAFYDAISPIVLAESIDMSKVFRASRWGRNVWSAKGADGALAALSADGRGRLPELPDDQGRIRRVLRGAGHRRVRDRSRLRQHQVLRRLPADRSDGASRRRHAAVRADEAGRPEGSAHRDSLPYAVVQLRQDTLAGDHYSLVGFQTQIKWGDQARAAADDSRARERRVRSLRHGASQHLHLRAEGAAADVADQASRRSVVRRPGVGRRRLRRVGGVGIDRRPQRRRDRQGRDAAGAAAHHRDRIARLLRVARRSEDLSADQHHARHHAAARQSAARQDEEEVDDRRARAGGPCSLDRQPEVVATKPRSVATNL